MNKTLSTFLISGTIMLFLFACKKAAVKDLNTTENQNELTTGVNQRLAGAQGRFNATYIDTIHYATPQLYIFNGTQYARYDVLTNTFKSVNSIAAGYPGVPFSSFDASYVDNWHYNNTAQLYIFSGTQYARYDIATNQYKGSNSIAAGYPGLPFSTIDAAYVDTYTFPGSPKLYVFSGNQYARYDIKTNTYESSTTINNYPGMPFTRIDAAYVDRYHYSHPQLYLFSGDQYARWDIITNTYYGTNSISAGYPGVPF